MPHRDAPLTETGRLCPARCAVDDGWPLRRAAERFQVSHTTAARWATRRRQLGIAGMSDRSGRPAPEDPGRSRRTRPAHRIGPLRLVVRCGIAASIATACHSWQPWSGPRVNPCDATKAPGPANCSTSTPPRSSDASRTAAAPEGPRPGGRQPEQGPPQRRGIRLSAYRPGRPQPPGLHRRPSRRNRRYLHGLPHPSRGLVRRPRRHVERILTDNACNAWTYTKNTWRQTCHELGISPHWTLPWRPQTNGKTHPFHRALIEEWAYRRPYTSDAERQTALTEWIDWYNYHRPHPGIAGHTPASRVTNLPESTPRRTDQSSDGSRSPLIAIAAGGPGSRSKVLNPAEMKRTSGCVAGRCTAKPCDVCTSRPWR